ncbi:cytochrome P450 [Phellopilus nigrolimitatus]|nr:cytochrome P450 [Phellopilus nigrolimitatus]
MAFFNQSADIANTFMGIDSSILNGANAQFAIAGTVVAIVAAFQYIKARNIKVEVPTLCSYGILGSYSGAYEFLVNAKAILNEGYKKYNLGTFKIPVLERWIVIVSKPELVEEIRKAPDDKFSFTEAAHDIIAARWTIGSNVALHSYHFSIIRSQLTRHLGSLFDDVRDEIMHAFADNIPAKENEWVSVSVLPAVRNIVSRTSNRIFVGLPLCRNQEYIDLSVQFAVTCVQTSQLINRLPTFLRPIVGAFLTVAPRSIRQGMTLLGPLVEERIRDYDAHGWAKDWPDKPADMISWLIDEAPENEKRSVRELTKRMLSVNFAAIHTSSNSFVHALYHLAAEPKYAEPLREEIERVIKEEGWTKVALTNMWKLDSFMKESQRYNGITMLTMNRKVLADYTLSDGTFLPAGSYVAANAETMHHDEAHYAHANTFEGFRFADMREEGADEHAATKHQMVATTPDYLAFGHGRHACPGRFFAVNELKAMMAYILLTYDVKMEVEGVRPPNVHTGARVSPNPDAKILFRKRA